MKREQIELIRKIKPSSHIDDRGDYPLGIVYPWHTIVGEPAYDLKGSPIIQPGLIPISLSHLSEMCGLDLSNNTTYHLPSIEIALNRVFDIFEDRSRGRRNERGELVYNLWGALNPENFLVLYMIADAIIRHKQENKKDKLRALFFGTGSGYPEVELVRLSLSYGLDIEVITVDRGAKILMHSLDARNAAYGPEEADGGLGCKIKEASKDIQNKIKIIEADANDNNSLQDISRAKCYDLIFIDDDHSFNSVSNRLFTSWELLVPGGVMCLDDFGGSKLATNPGVSGAAYHFAGAKRTSGYFVSSPTDPFFTNSAFFIKDERLKAS